MGRRNAFRPPTPICVSHGDTAPAHSPPPPWLTAHGPPRNVLLTMLARGGLGASIAKIDDSPSPGTGIRDENALVRDLPTPVGPVPLLLGQGPDVSRGSGMHVVEGGGHGKTRNTARHGPSSLPRVGNMYMR